MEKIIINIVIVLIQGIVATIMVAISINAKTLFNKLKEKYGFLKKLDFTLIISALFIMYIVVGILFLVKNLN